MNKNVLKTNKKIGNYKIQKILLFKNKTSNIMMVSKGGKENVYSCPFRTRRIRKRVVS